MAPCVRKAGGGIADCLLGQTKCKQMCSVIKMMQQESSSLFCRRPPHHGNAQRGDLLFSCPQQRSHTNPHMDKTHTPTVLKLTLSTKPCSFSRASLNKVVFSPNWDCEWTEQIFKLPWFYWFNSGMIFESNETVRTARFTYLQFFQAQLCASKWEKRQSVLVWSIKNSLHIIYHIHSCYFSYSCHSHERQKNKINSTMIETEWNWGSSPPSVHL